MTEHPDPRLIRRYTDGDELDEVTLWSLEAHLESCGDCRSQQAELLTGPAAAGGLLTGRDLLQRVALELDEQIRTGPASLPVDRSRRAWRRRWAAGSLLPWVAMTIGVLLAALALSLTAPHRPSLVLLVAPVLPLLGVAGTWSRRTDPAWELIAGSPRVGLRLLLRRTAAVLAVVIPLLLLAGWVGGLSPGLWLLPCLGLVLSTLALGERVGLVPAAAGIWAVWTVTVLLPSLLTARVPAVLQTSATPGWLALSVVAAGFVAFRGGGYPRLINRL
jgi:hypothetical protein